MCVLYCIHCTIRNRDSNIIVGVNVYPYLITNTFTPTSIFICIVRLVLRGSPFAQTALYLYLFLSCPIKSTSCRFLPKLFLHMYHSISCVVKVNDTSEKILLYYIRIVNFVCWYLCIVGSKIQWPPMHTLYQKSTRSRFLLFQQSSKIQHCVFVYLPLFTLFFTWPLPKIHWIFTSILHCIQFIIQYGILDFRT